MKEYDRRHLIQRSFRLASSGVVMGVLSSHGAADPGTDDRTCPPSGCGGPAADFEQDQWSGDNGILRPNIYEKHRGFMTTQSRLLDIIFDTDNDRALFEVHTLLNSEIQRKYKWGGWQKANYVDGHGITLDFPDKQVLTAQSRGESQSTWLGSQLDGEYKGGYFSDNDRQRIKTMFSAIAGALPVFGEVQSANDYLQAVVPNEYYKTAGDYDFLWGSESERASRGGGRINPRHWTRCLVIDDSPDEDDRFEIEGSIEHDMVGIGIDNRNHYHLLQTTPRAPGEELEAGQMSVVSNKNRIELKRKEIESMGVDLGDNIELTSIRS